MYVATWLGALVRGEAKGVSKEPAYFRVHLQ